MAYTGTTWTDEALASTPPRFKISQSTDGDIAASAKIELVTTVSTPGTAVNASNLNHLETGLETAAGVADTALANAATAQAAADNAHADAATAQAAANAAQAAADAAQADADTALTQITNLPTSVIGYAEDNTVSSFSGATPTEILSLSVTMPKAGTLMAWISGYFSADSGATAIVTLTIDGTLCGTQNYSSGNTVTMSISLNYRKAVSSGARVIQLHAYAPSGTGGQVTKCNILAMGITS